MFLTGVDMTSLPGAVLMWVDPTGLTAEGWRQSLCENLPEILISGWDTPRIPESFAGLKNLCLRYVCHLGGGISVPRQLFERNVLVTNWGTSISYTIAEQAMLLTLGALRNLPLWASVRDMPADRSMILRTQSLRGKRVGVHGFGGIARELVQMLRGFRVDIAAYSEGVPPDLFESLKVKRCDSLVELFSTSDVIIECEALSSHSRGSVTESLLRLLPQDAAFINIARGALVEEEALLRLAAEGRIRVALDVLQNEPVSPDSQWYRIPGVLLSPHLAGPTSNAFSVAGNFAMENLRRYLSGEKTEGVVTLEAYERYL